MYATKEHLRQLVLDLQADELSDEDYQLLRHLYLCCYGKFFRHLGGSRVVQWDDIDDTFHVFLTRIWTSRHRLQPDGNVFSYLTTSALNALRLNYRNRETALRHYQDEWQVGKSPELAKGRRILHRPCNYDEDQLLTRFVEMTQG